MNPIGSISSLPLPINELNGLRSAQAIPKGNLEALKALKDMGTVDTPRQLDALGGARQAGATDSIDTFSNMLDQLVDDVNGKQVEAGETLRAVMTGEDVPLHHAMISMQEAGVAFRLMVEVRNKMLEAYQELMRMQV